jgi:hypothetical protein
VKVTIPPQCIFEELSKVVNDTLANAMQKNSKSWNGLSRAQQASIADIIAKKKESY